MDDRMSRFRLLLRNLRFFRGVNFAVVVGVAVATAVLTGALMVGDSVRGSLRALALRRLGDVDDALVSPRFFDVTLADRLRREAAVAGRYDITPAILVRGGMATESNTARTGGVQIGAAASGELAVPHDTAVINGEVSKAIGVDRVGTTVLLSIPIESDQPREA